jgi:RimJ/RimL family protein N-acetyltransferase
VGEAKAKLEGKLEAKLDPELGAGLGAELVPELGAELPVEAIAKSLALPLKPAAVTLVGKYVKLLPIDLQRDNEALFAVSNGSPCELGAREIDSYDADALIWRYMSAGPFPTSCKLAAFLFAQEKAENGLCFCVFDLATDRQIGVVNYLNNFPAHLKIELGNIWFSPLVQRTKTNLEATYLLLQHAFNLGYRRVEWKCDALNLRSRKAALRMGFKFEGIQENHFIIKGRNRDTAWFRILDSEWPDVQKLLQLLLEKEQ